MLAEFPQQNEVMQKRNREGECTSSTCNMKRRRHNASRMQGIIDGGEGDKARKPGFAQPVQA
jgi:hypothetical protein